MASFKGALPGRFVMHRSYTVRGLSELRSPRDRPGLRPNVIAGGHSRVHRMSEQPAWRVSSKPPVWFLRRGPEDSLAWFIQRPAPMTPAAMIATR